MFGRARAQVATPLPDPQLCVECPMCRTTINAESTAGVCASCPLYHVKGGCRIELIACPQCGYHSLPQEHPLPGQADAHPPSDNGATPPGSGEPTATPSEATPSETTPAETMPTETMPTETMPTETMPTEAMPTEWNGSAAACSGALRLSDVAAGTEARLLGFSGIDDDYLGRLTAYGLLPGVSIEVLQRFPAIIVGVYQAELALETELADGVWVLPRGETL